MKSMCSTTWATPLAPKGSLALPALKAKRAEKMGALWRSTSITVRPLGSTFFWMGMRTWAGRLAAATARARTRRGRDKADSLIGETPSILPFRGGVCPAPGERKLRRAERGRPRDHPPPLAILITPPGR